MYMLPGTYEELPLDSGLGSEFTHSWDMLTHIIFLLARENIQIQLQRLFLEINSKKIFIMEFEIKSPPTKDSDC